MLLANLYALIHSCCYSIQVRNKDSLSLSVILSSISSRFMQKCLSGSTNTGVAPLIVMPITEEMNVFPCTITSSPSLMLKITKVIRQYHAKLIRLLYPNIRIILQGKFGVGDADFVRFPHSHLILCATSESVIYYNKINSTKTICTIAILRIRNSKCP